VIIDITKPVQTKGGLHVEIISDKGRDPYPLVGYLVDSTLPRCWTINGKHKIGELDPNLDLKNVLEPKRVPLAPNDVPTGAEFMAPGGERYQWSRIARDVISLDSFVKTFTSLMETGWQIKRPGEDWKPCSKEVKP
jgi:hypothetical protein